MPNHFTRPLRGKSQRENETPTSKKFQQNHSRKTITNKTQILTKTTIVLFVLRKMSRCPQLRPRCLRGSKKNPPQTLQKIVNDNDEKICPCPRPCRPRRHATTTPPKTSTHASTPQTATTTLCKLVDHTLDRHRNDRMPGSWKQQLLLHLESASLESEEDRPSSSASPWVPDRAVWPTRHSRNFRFRPAGPRS